MRCFNRLLRRSRLKRRNRFANIAQKKVQSFTIIRVGVEMIWKGSANDETGVEWESQCHESMEDERGMGH